ncbi:unnamed protein product [Acanthoscelides obtectus]|nr:unnamed protein product [Acanthoscelides obtectus]CAK1646366.1 hypothetical protein AOBTE_LOCUS14602 [Acanthoscelides obtectus]
MYGTYRQLRTGYRSFSSPELELYTRPESPEQLPPTSGKSMGLRFQLEHCN